MSRDDAPARDALADAARRALRLLAARHPTPRLSWAEVRASARRALVAGDAVRTP